MIHFTCECGAWLRHDEEENIWCQHCGRIHQHRGGLRITSLPEGEFPSWHKVAKEPGYYVAYPPEWRGVSPALGDAHVRSKKKS